MCIRDRLLSDQALVRLERIGFYQKEKKMLLQLVDLTVVPGKSFWTRHSFVMNFPRQILNATIFLVSFLTSKMKTFDFPPSTSVVNLALFLETPVSAHLR